MPRFVVASLVAFWLGEFTNSYALAKMKLWTNGKWLWTRTVGSTITGRFVDVYDRGRISIRSRVIGGSNG